MIVSMHVFVTNNVRTSQPVMSSSTRFVTECEDRSSGQLQDVLLQVTTRIDGQFD